MKTYVVKQIKRNGLIVKESEFVMCPDACDYALDEAMKHLHCVFDIYARSEQGDVFLQRL